MWVVTGATGQLGQHIVESLLKRVSAREIGVSVRDAAKAHAWAELGVRVRAADYEDPTSLQTALEGASQVVMVSSNASAYGADPLKQHRNVIEAAKAAGVRRILYTSHMAAGATSAFPPMHDHAATEAILATSSLRWTSLRNGFYASSALAMTADGMQRGVLSFPEDGKVSWTAHRDLADATVQILLDEGRFEGPTPPLTAVQTLDLAELAALGSQIQGRPVRREVISDAEFQTRLTGFGVPAARSKIMLGLFLASRAGEFASTDNTLADLLGRAPTSVRELMTAGP